MIVNLTPHPVVVLDDSNHVIDSIPPAGAVVRCAVSETREQDMLRISDCVHALDDQPLDVAVYRVGFGAAVGLPEPADGVVYIVSQAVTAAVPQRKDLVYPHRLVRDAAGAVIGCRAFGRPA